MIPISNEIRTLILVFVAILTVILGILLIILDADIRYYLKKWLPGLRPGPEPEAKPFWLWLVFYFSIFASAIGGAIASTAPDAPPSIPEIILPAKFNEPIIINVIEDFEIAGYGKQSCIAVNSKNNLALFVRNQEGKIGIISTDNTDIWSKPYIFDTLPPPGSPGVSLDIDSSDKIHVIWSKQPEASDLFYRVYNSLDEKWIGEKTIIATSTFAKDIIVDSANNPHVIWSGIDTTYTSYNGSKWDEPQNILSAAWHPDIQITSNDDIFVFANDGSFYPNPNVSVFFTNNIDNYWKSPSKIVNSPFWSGGIASTIDLEDNIYATWLGAKSVNGGDDVVYFSYLTDENLWANPIAIGELRTSGGSTGAESPLIASDSNNTIYIIWRGLNEKNRPVIYARAFIPPSSKTIDLSPGWSETIVIDDRNASNVLWPCIGSGNPLSENIGVSIAWNSIIGTKNIVNYTKLTYP